MGPAPGIHDTPVRGLKMTTSILEAVALGISFGSPGKRNMVVDRASFVLRRGESYGLIGESGCGKSTILRALAGSQTEYSGSILLEGRELPRKRDRPFFRRVQMVFQDPYASLHPRKVVHEVLAEPLRVHRFDRVEERVGEALRSVGLGPGFRYRYPNELSGGQRQRVALARALVMEPDILLLDEPTSALDVSVQAEILNLLYQLRRERGLTYVMVSHDLAVVAHLCERIGVMSSGRIVEEVDVSALRAGRVASEVTLAFVEATRHPVAHSGSTGEL